MFLVLPGKPSMSTFPLFCFTFFPFSHCFIGGFSAFLRNMNSWVLSLALLLSAFEIICDSESNSLGADLYAVLVGVSFVLFWHFNHHSTYI